MKLSNHKPKNFSFYSENGRLNLCNCLFGILSDLISVVIMSIKYIDHSAFGQKDRRTKEKKVQKYCFMHIFFSLSTLNEFINAHAVIKYTHTAVDSPHSCSTCCSCCLYFEHLNFLQTLKKIAL